MKFLCGNCKAKYQIADEKISGRTLRMKCRRCSHDIIIRGDQVESAPPAAVAAAVSAPRAPAPQARRAGPVAAAPAPRANAPVRRPTGSALGADFRRSLTGSAPPPPAPPPAELWHVAINDVPVGPIRKEEIARKVQTGAVNGESLVWREGFDDWRPLKEVAELAALLRRERPPAPSRPSAVGRGIGARTQGSRPRIRPVAPAQRPSSRPADASRPAARSNVVPIGGRLGAAAAPAIEEHDMLEEPTRVSDPVFDPDPVPAAAIPAPAATLSSIPQAATDDEMFGGYAGAASVPSASVSASYTEPPKRRKRAVPIGAWIAIAGAGAFGITLAAIVGTKMLTEPSQPLAVADTTSPTQEDPVEADVTLDQPVEEPAVEEPAVEETDEPATAGAANAAKRARQTAKQPAAASGRQLTAEQAELLRRMGQDPGASVGNIHVDEGNSASATNRQSQLTPAQLSTVVNRNKPALRRCYEESQSEASASPRRFAWTSTSPSAGRGA